MIQPTSYLDFLVIGTITRDLLEGNDLDSGYILGGTVTFAAMTALRLGRQPTIITRAAADIDVSDLSSEVNLHLLPSEITTTFANIYLEHRRQQYCYTPTASITPTDIPETMRKPRVVLLGPLVDDMDAAVSTIFHDETLVAAVPQGWMRRWDENGRVDSKPWENAEAILPHLDALVLSLEDIDYDLKWLELFCTHVPLVVVTEYRDGSTLYQRQEDGTTKKIKIPPRPADEVDPTGAGDIFATAFLLRLQEIGDPVESARFANVTASFGVEGEGIASIPCREQVLAYMQEHPMVST